MGQDWMQLLDEAALLRADHAPALRVQVL